MTHHKLARDALKMEYIALCLLPQVGFQSCSPNPTKYDKKWSYRRIDFIPHVLLKTLVVEYLKWANFLSIGWSHVQWVKLDCQSVIFINSSKINLTCDFSKFFRFKYLSSPRIYQYMYLHIESVALLGQNLPIVC